MEFVYGESDIVFVANSVQSEDYINVYDAIAMHCISALKSLYLILSIIKELHLHRQD